MGGTSRTPRRKRRGIAAALAAAATVALATGGALTSTAGATSAATPSASASDTGATTQCPWLNQKLPVSTRVNELLSVMTLAEKTDLLGLANSGDYENVTTAIPQLCVPQFELNDGPAGIIAGPADSHTQLPSPIGLAATFDQSAASEYGKVLGGEAAAKGIDVVQGPVLNIDRVPLDGRTFETLGEDPYLTSQTGVDIERGIESQGVGSMPKHFAVYNQEKNRNTPSDDAIVSQQALEEIYLPAWQATVAEGHPSAVMCSYASLNGGGYDCQNPDLLTTILRDQMGFTGFIRSDLDAVHDPVTGFNAGTDQLKTAEPTALQDGVIDGQIPEARMNQAVSLVLTQMFELGVFNRQPAGNADSDASTPAHVAFARQLAEESTVLLQNTGSILPLSAQTGSIAVIGADGGSGALTASPSPSSSYVSSDEVVTPYEGISQAAPAGTTVTYNDGSSPTAAAAAAQAASVAVVFVDVPESEGTDLTTLSLPGNQDQLIEAVAAANPNTVVVINSATPVLMPWLSQVKGVLDAWYPGQQDGNAIAAVLFGSADPGGKLPLTFPTSLSEDPVSTPAQYPGVNGQVDYSEGLDVGYRWYDANDVTPLFPFGYGLSYTTFSFSHLTISPGRTTSLGNVRVTATVTNTGTRAGSDVAQLYLGDPSSAGQPPRQLKGYQKVTLKPGQSTRVQFTLTTQDLSYYDSDASAWTVPEGGFQVYVGDSSALADLPLSGSFQVSGTAGTRHVTLSAPGTAEAGVPFTVSATLTSGGDIPVSDAQLRLSVPTGWRATPVHPAAAGTLAAGRALTTSWQVTAPASAQDNISQLTTTATYRGGAGTSTASSSLSTQVTVDPLVTTTVTPQSAITAPGQATAVTLENTDTSGFPVTVTWGAAPASGSGITTAPASGSDTLAPGGHDSTTLSVAAAAGSALGTTTVPVSVTADVGRIALPAPGAYLPVAIPASSLSALFSNVGITDNSDPSAGNFDGAGNSYSAEALAAAGITPGSAVTADGVTFTWPDVAAGQPDNAPASGQSFALSGSGSTLGFLGSAANGTQTGTGTIFYTDGSTQSFTLSFANWTTDTPASGSVLVTTTAYENRTNSGHVYSPSLFAASVPLQPGKTVAAVQLPDNTNIHIFAVSTG